MHTLIAELVDAATHPATIADELPSEAVAANVVVGARTDTAALLRRLTPGAIKPVIAGTFPLREAAAALERSEARGLFGKVVIVT